MKIPLKVINWNILLRIDWKSLFWLDVITITKTITAAVIITATTVIIIITTTVIIMKTTTTTKTTVIIIIILTTISLRSCPRVELTAHNRTDLRSIPI